MILVPQARGGRPGHVSGADLGLVEAEAQRQTRERDAFRADQFTRDDARQAHAQGTAPEIWEQSGQAITGFVDFVGSGGTLGGAALYLAEKGVTCYGVEPKGAEALSFGDMSVPDHPIQGGGYGMADLAHLAGASVTGIIAVDPARAVATARLLARHEGIFGGYSGGANVAAAIQLLRGPEAGATIAAMICDSGMKYLSTDLWGPTDGS